MSVTGVPSRLGGIVLLLVLPVLSSCGDRFTGPSTDLPRAQLITAGEAIFRQTVLVALDLPRTSTSTPGLERVLECSASGSALTTTRISGTSDVDTNAANLSYDLVTIYDGCIEGGGAGEVEINTNSGATGVVGDFTYQAFSNGEVEIDGSLSGRVLLTNESVTLNCQVLYTMRGDESSEEGVSLTFSVVGDICGSTFGFELDLET